MGFVNKVLLARDNCVVVTIGLHLRILLHYWWDTTSLPVGRRGSEKWGSEQRSGIRKGVRRLLPGSRWWRSERGRTLVESATYANEDLWLAVL